MGTESMLVVEDDAAIQGVLTATLRSGVFRTHCVASAAEALAAVVARSPALVLTDLGLPDMNGIALTRLLRARSAIPILVMTGSHDEEDKINAFEAGANDYVTKPFSSRELHARIRVWLSPAAPNGASSLLEVGDLRLDLARRLVFVAGVEVHLTRTQYKLFEVLMRNAGKVVTHRQLLQAVWGKAYALETQYLRVYTNQLRQKLERDPSRPRYLVTENGVGYRIRTAEGGGDAR